MFSSIYRLIDNLIIDYSLIVGQFVLRLPLRPNDGFSVSSSFFLHLALPSPHTVPSLPAAVTGSSATIPSPSAASPTRDTNALRMPSDPLDFLLCQSNSTKLPATVLVLRLFALHCSLSSSVEFCPSSASCHICRLFRLQPIRFFRNFRSSAAHSHTIVKTTVDECSCWTSSSTWRKQQLLAANRPKCPFTRGKHLPAAATFIVPFYDDLDITGNNGKTETDSAFVQPHGPPAPPDELFTYTTTIPPPPDELFTYTTTIPPPPDELFTYTTTIPPPPDELFTYTTTIPPPPDELFTYTTTIPPLSPPFPSNEKSFPTLVPPTFPNLERSIDGGSLTEKKEIAEAVLKNAEGLMDGSAGSERGNASTSEGKTMALKLPELMGELEEFGEGMQKGSENGRDSAGEDERGAGTADVRSAHQNGEDQQQVALFESRKCSAHQWNVRVRPHGEGQSQSVSVASRRDVPMPIFVGKGKERQQIIGEESANGKAITAQRGDDQQRSNSELVPGHPFASTALLTRSASSQSTPDQCGVGPNFVPCVPLGQANARILSCCQQKQMPTGCLALCRYDTTQAQMKQAFEKGQCGLLNIAPFLSCASQGQNNVQCCRHREIVKRSGVQYNARVPPRRSSFHNIRPSFALNERISRIHHIFLSSFFGIDSSPIQQK
uniref:Domain of unknown function DB domain-containing protein n=1 Tax=Globodera rostochiensis TaxID=31243 RepID=A0A914GWN4_GLORO